jgi:ubiquinone/menaquinone biosynthesis C-methylase UbiE
VNEQTRWQLGASAPELYQRYLVPAMTAIWAADLVDRVVLRPGQGVLDVACGTGVVAQLAVERVGDDGRVAAVDINPGMLDVARSLPTSGGSIGWCRGDVTALPFADDAFDVVLCQFGLQFFPDRTAALRQIRRVLVARGLLAFNVFGPISDNPATHALADSLDVRVGPEASEAKRTEHALADLRELRELLERNRFGNVVIRTLSKMVRFASASDYVRIQLTATPLASLVSDYDTAQIEQLIAVLAADVGARLSDFIGPDGLSFPQVVHVVLTRPLQ